ncbi:Soluble inorganic pyrophosphatase PPA1 [Sesamum angolense]|uniref:inorganic diphosphatase n=1 Tax=Sesamum angolense TaxID=2727404 RepID=A0AAE1WFN8_9LAMI|nr:Soluble inorganic pyrophosphatase PPA1 [Sesamum angolense]
MNLTRTQVSSRLIVFSIHLLCTPHNYGFIPRTLWREDDKIIAVCADDPEYRDYTDIKELPPHRLAEIRRFFEDYKKNENKDVEVDESFQPQRPMKQSNVPLDISFLSWYSLSKRQANRKLQHYIVIENL